MTRRAALLLAAGIPVALAREDEKARKQAEKWLAKVDAGEYKDSWKRFTRHFRSQVSRDQWESQVKQMRESAGRLTERQLTVTRPTETLAGAPGGEYVIVEFTSEFANKPRAVERVVLGREGRGWKIAAYDIR